MLLNVGPLRMSVIRSFGLVPGSSIYVCHEFWNFALGSAPVVRETYALHRLADGRLLYRLQHSPDWMTSDGTLALQDKGEIHALPPKPNYSLVAFCQTILALPIIFLWAVLRWRQNRKARMARGQREVDI